CRASKTATQSYQRDKVIHQQDSDDHQHTLEEHHLQLIVTASALVVFVEENVWAGLLLFPVEVPAVHLIGVIHEVALVVVSLVRVLGRATTKHQVPPSHTYTQESEHVKREQTHKPSLVCSQATQSL